MQNKMLESVELILLRGDYARIQYRRTFFMGEGYRESDAVSAGTVSYTHLTLPTILLV